MLFQYFALKSKQAYFPYAVQAAVKILNAAANQNASPSRSRKNAGRLNAKKFFFLRFAFRLAETFLKACAQEAAAAEWAHAQKLADKAAVVKSGAVLSLLRAACPPSHAVTDCSQSY
ncbi:MAG: hypothetical protein ABJZ55_18635 [Fuerstiella sp.]